MRVTADFDQCEANGICVGFAPEVFELDDDDYLQIHDVDGEESAARVARAVASCPKNALRIEE